MGKRENLCPHCTRSALPQAFTAPAFVADPHRRSVFRVAADAGDGPALIGPIGSCQGAAWVIRDRSTRPPVLERVFAMRTFRKA